MLKNKIYCTIFSYLREEMLDNLLKEIYVFNTSNELNYIIEYIILDDGSEFTKSYENIVKFDHEGKPGFWKKWDYAFKNIKDKDFNIALFIPSDYSQLNFEKIIENHISKEYNDYIYNVANDGRTQCWNDQQNKLKMNIFVGLLIVVFLLTDKH